MSGIFKCVKILLLSVIAGLCIQSNVSAWSMDSQPEYVISGGGSTNSLPCSGLYTVIILKTELQTEACVMGSSTRVASYYISENRIAYAVSFPSDSVYYPLTICRDIWGCVYSEEKDIFVEFTRRTGSLKTAIFYKNFIKNLSKSTIDDVSYFSSNGNSTLYTVANTEGDVFDAESVAISQNGEWALVEVQRYGVFRIDTRTSEMRRISAPGTIYSQFSRPVVEMAISNDGKTSAVMGLGKDIMLYSVDSSCGDVPDTSMQSSFADTSIACSSLRVSTSSFVSSFYYAAKPKFSDSNKSLSFDIHEYFQPPRHVTLFSESGMYENKLDYLAVGDSFTSGEGEIDDSFYIGGEANKCHLSSRSYPYLLATQWNVSGYNAACSGATIKAARGQKLNENQPSQLLKVEEYLPHLLTVGIGANDAGFMGKLKTCIGLDTCEWAASADKRRSTALEIKNLYASLKHFYDELKVKVSGKVLVIGYPKIILDNAPCIADAGLMFNQIERQFMNEGVHYLNQVIKAAATDSRVEYVDVEGAFAGSELCSQNTLLSMNAVRFGGEVAPLEAFPQFKVIGAESFHPTPTGQRNLADAIYQQFPDYDIPEHCVTCGDNTGPPQPSDYWDEGTQNNTPQQRAVPFLNKVSVKKGDSFEISIPTFSFEPGTDVTIELHSGVRKIDILKSSDDGSFGTTIWVQDLEPGFHSLHAIGRNFAGETVDIYDFLTIEGQVEAPGSSIVRDESENVTTTVRLGETKSPPLLLNLTESVLLDTHGASGVLGVAQNTLQDLAMEKKVSTTKKATQLPVRTYTGTSFIVYILSSLIGFAIASGVFAAILYKIKRSHNSG